jgi:hypothetical protein
LADAQRADAQIFPGTGDGFAPGILAKPRRPAGSWGQRPCPGGRILAELLEEAEQNAPAIATAVDELAAIEAVVLADGQVLPLDNGNLVAVLRRDDVQAARARLAALQRARTLLGDTPTPAADQTFAQLDEILSRSEFGRVREPARNPSLLQRALEWLYERLFPWLDRVASQPGVEPLLAAASVVVMLAVLAYIFRSSWRQWAAEGRSGEDNGSDKEADLSSGKALERAQALAGASDYRRAVRYLYLSTLLWLDERRLLHYDPACTNREFLHQVRDQARLHEALLPVVDLFDQVWYGFVPLDGRGYAAYARQVERVRQVGGAG